MNYDLKAWREKNDLTQQDAADALGISRRTLVAYEQGGSEVPRVVEYACNWLDKNPAAIQPRDRFRIPLSEGGTAGTREVAIASFALIQGTLARLRADNLVSRQMLLEICNSAIDEQNEIPTGDEPWTRPVVNLIRDVFYTLEPHRQQKKKTVIVDRDRSKQEIIGNLPSNRVS